MIEDLKKVVKRIPGAVPLYRAAVRAVLASRSVEDRFTTIYSRNKWGDPESVSGPGSSTAQTRVVIAELEALIRDRKIATMLDVPCGDFQWMSQVAMEHVDYVGADVVSDLVAANQAKYQSPRRTFRKLNLISDALPKVDLVFCRDCLVHFSDEHVLAAIKNMCASGSTYLLTTTFITRPTSPDIITGQWRALNLEAQPFAFPTPLLVIDEMCTEGGGKYADKSLALWAVDDLRRHLEARGRR